MLRTVGTTAKNTEQIHPDRHVSIGTRKEKGEAKTKRKEGGVKKREEKYLGLWGWKVGLRTQHRSAVRRPHTRGAQVAFVCSGARNTHLLRRCALMASWFAYTSKPFACATGFGFGRDRDCLTVLGDVVGVEEPLEPELSTAAFTADEFTYNGVAPLAPPVLLLRSFTGVGGCRPPIIPVRPPLPLDPVRPPRPCRTLVPTPLPGMAPSSPLHHLYTLERKQQPLFLVGPTLFVRESLW